MRSSAFQERLGRWLGSAVALQLALLGVLKLVGEADGAWFPPFVLRATALLELLLAAAVLVQTCRRRALWGTLACAGAFLVTNVLVVPAHASCGCMGGISVLEAHRNAWSSVLGITTVWALWATHGANAADRRGGLRRDESMAGQSGESAA